MNKPQAGQTEPEARTIAPERSAAGRALADRALKLDKPTGPLVYRIEKGADVWPRRK
jgi:hypothetical protein